MDYHSDRFEDASLLFYTGDAPIALLPANLRDRTLFSHEGLTFGGVVSGNRMTTGTMIDLFEALLEYLKARGIAKLVYKAVPHIYHSLPAEEDLYALFRTGATLIRRDLSLSIYMPDRMRFQERRRRVIRKAGRRALSVSQSFDFDGFMGTVARVLMERHGVQPVHTGDEMELLASRFPDNIKLFTACDNGSILAGTIIYESDNVAHCQYLASSPEGREAGALDAVINYLVSEHYGSKKYFDFGISTERDGRFLNAGLCEFKEGFGARAVAYDWYGLGL
jgi:hypothetical protein